MANEDTTTRRDEGPGFFDTAWNYTKDTAQTLGQIAANESPALAVPLAFVGIKPDSIRQQQEAEQFQAKQRLAWEYDQVQKRKADERADQRWRWDVESRPMVEEAAQRELRQQRVAAGKSAYDRFSATSKSAVGRLLGELDPETTDADIAETLNSEAARDFMDFNTYGAMLMSQDPAVREYAIEQARASGVEISEVDGKYFLSAKGLEKSIEATPQALSLMRDEAQRKVADQLAAVRVRRERQAHVMGYTQNRRTDDLLRLGHDLPSAMRDEQAFSKAFSPHETRVNSVWRSLTDIFEDGKMTAEEKQEYAPQLMYLAKQMNVPYTETTDGQILINGTPAKEYAAGQLANDPVEIAWKNRLTAYQDRSAAIVAAEAAKRGKKAPGAEAANDATAEMPESVKEVYTTGQEVIKRYDLGGAAEEMFRQKGNNKKITTREDVVKLFGLANEDAEQAYLDNRGAMAYQKAQGAWEKTFTDHGVPRPLVPDLWSDKFIANRIQELNKEIESAVKENKRIKGSPEAKRYATPRADGKTEPLYSPFGGLREGPFSRTNEQSSYDRYSELVDERQELIDLQKQKAASRTRGKERREVDSKRLEEFRKAK